MTHHSTRYLIVGSSHAALEAVNAIRMHDADGTLTVATRDTHLPYSPTVLPYVVSGQRAPEKILLRDAGWQAAQRLDYRTGLALKALHADRQVAEFADGSALRYEKLLLATGASPVVPPIEGITDVKFHVLRTMDDAVKLNAAMKTAKRAVVLGAGLVGMHAAENLVKAGVPVSLVEMAEQLTSGYFDRTAATLIEQAFRDHGATILTGRRAVRAEATPEGARLTLHTGETVEADLLLVASGVRPELDYLNGSGIATDRGILVDDAMQTSVAHVWAAGDCAQAKNFFTGKPTMNAILPAAAEQGRIAGMAMAGDPGLRAYPGGVAVNTYHFFGRHAISVGSSSEPVDAEVMTRFDEGSGRYLKMILNGGCLHGIYGVNEFFDAGIMSQLILRKTDLSAHKERLFAHPLATGRELMSRLWR